MTNSQPMRKLVLTGLALSATLASNALANDSHRVSPTLASATALESARQNSTQLPQPNVIYYDAIENGEIVDGGVIQADQANPMMAPMMLKSTAPAPIYNSQTILNNGPEANRVDIVLVGDGYTASEINSYTNHANNLVSGFFNEGVLANYKPYFNVHRVDVISTESGVDNDPQGTLRDTALDMQYYCSNIARLLCVNVSKARDAASNAPATDQILALANSTTYGGAGYPSSDLGTVAGNNGSALEVAIHEFGHSFADLADEYTYGGSETYTGPEPSQVNISIYQTNDMQQQQAKWFRWLDLAEVDTFEGAHYSVYGIYRPTSNSKMRSLGQPFGPINDEQMIIKIYQTVSPIDSATPAGTVNKGTILNVSAVQPLDHDLTVQWWIDGTLSNVSDSSFDTNSLSAGNHTIAVRVIDETDKVRNETARQTWMTAERVWTVIDNGGVSSADLSLSLKSTSFMGWAQPFQFWKNDEQGTISFKATITNNGPDAANDIRLTQSIPIDTQWLNAESDIAGCFIDNAQVVCEANSLNVSDNLEITLNYSTLSSERFEFDAEVSGNTQDPDSNNNASTGTFGGSLGIYWLIALGGLASRKLHQERKN